MLVLYFVFESVRIVVWYRLLYLDGRGSIYDIKYGLGNVLYKWIGNIILIILVVVGLSDII